jgi:hypothetical protein
MKTKEFKERIAAIDEDQYPFIIIDKEDAQLDVIEVHTRNPVGATITIEARR